MGEPHYPQFFTATILEWKHLLQGEAHKNIIVDSLKFLAEQKRATIYSFVIMPNHIHLIWQIHAGHEQSKVQHSFLKYTAQQIKFELQKANPLMLEQFKVDARDREYQFWERNPLSIDLFSHEVFMQKLNYIHNNPIQEKWKLAVMPEEYKWSSAAFYMHEGNDFGFLMHFVDGSAEAPAV